MIVQAEQPMTITATNPDHIMVRQHSQDSTISHLSPTMNQTIHAQVSANFSHIPDGKGVRFKRLEMLQKSLTNEATSSNDPRSRAYAILHERTKNPELRSQYFLEIPVTRQGLAGGKGESSSYEINEKREEISQTQTRIENLQGQVTDARNSLSDPDADKNALRSTIHDLTQSILSERRTLYRLQNQLSNLLRNA